MTQKELAYQAGCSVGTIRKIEADGRRPSRQLATLLAQHLDIPPEQHEAFISFARAEPYTADISLPSLAPADEQTLAIPTLRQEAPARPVRHNLPSETTPFLGRKTELAALDDLFTHLDRRLVTVVGPGGIGKTRLALAYAEQQVTQPPSEHSFANGVFFVNLAPLLEAERLIVTLAETLGLLLQGGAQEKRSPMQQLLDYLSSRHLLLVFDNFEHLLSPHSSLKKDIETDGAAQAAEILQTAPNVRILVTSRERLNLQLEQVFPIEGLAFPDWETAVPEDAVEDAVEYPAVQLFLQTAQRSQPDFSLETHEERSALVRICRLVSGMPLALELAASWTDKLSLVDIAAELQHGLDILETELHDVPQRQHSLRATFDTSWRQLDEKEQSVFAQLSIFRGGFTRPAAQAVTGATLQQLSRLVNKSFIQFVKRRDRYQLHELLRQYGADKLSQDHELERVVCESHSTYFCQELGALTDDLKGARQQQALSTIEADIENVRLAWNNAIARQDFEAIGISLESYWRFYSNRNWWMQGANDLEKAAILLRTGEAVGRRGIVLGRVLASLSWLYLYRQWGRAQEYAQNSLDLLQRMGAWPETFVPLIVLAEVQDSLEESIRLLEESLGVARDSGNRWAIGDAMLRIGEKAHMLGDYEKAERSWREALQQFRRTSDPGGIAIGLVYFSILAGDSGRYQEALALVQEADSLRTHLSESYIISSVLGTAKMNLGTYKEAEAQFQQALIFTREHGTRAASLEVFFLLGKLAFNTGDYSLARQQYHESLAGALELDYLTLVAQNHDALGRLKMVQDDNTGVRERFRAALQAVMTESQPPNNSGLMPGRIPVLLACLASIAELFVAEGNMGYAALLALLITNHPASQAKVKERGTRLLNRLEAQLSANDLANIRPRSRPSDLDAVAAQILKDLESM